jgi:hypothetical protein
VGDQIGRIFSRWVIIYARQFLKITEVAHTVGLFFHSTYINVTYALIFTQKGLGYILGDFLTI